MSLAKKALDARWHEAHRMPRGATLSQRIAWHVAHAKACGCREMPASIRAALGAGTKPAGGRTPSVPAERPKRAKRKRAQK